MGTTERRERDRERRRGEIIDAAERVFFSKGHEQSTVDDIADEAELSKGTIYLYFDSKEEILYEIVYRGHKILTMLFKEAVTSSATGIDRVAAIGKAYTRFFSEYNGYFEAMLNYHGEHKIASEDVNPMFVLTGAISSGIEDGTIRADLDPLKTGLMLWGQTFGSLRVAFTVFNDLQACCGISPEELIEYYNKQVLVCLRK